MPLVRIDLIEKQHPEKDISAIGDAVQAALVETMNVPQRDRFQVITEHRKDRFVYNPSYLGVERTDRIVFVQVFLSKGRTTEQKQAFYASVATRMANAGMRPEDLAVALVENTREDWSFGNGVAQYVVLPKEEWK
ncbi:MAG TPA: tautomerase family protein [Usitatibacter sp.]|nr:tautomerase family protein [Usitatibacter sp.]